MKKNPQKPPSHSRGLYNRIWSRVSHLALNRICQERKYQVLQDQLVIDKIFEKLRVDLFSGCESGDFREHEMGQETDLMPRELIFKEFGKLQPGRKYFYMKQKSGRAWLFERSGIGWLVSRCEKIVQDSLFLRDGPPEDIVTVFGRNNPSGAFRISSEYHSGELISYPVYERMMLRMLLASPTQILADQDSDGSLCASR